MDAPYLLAGVIKKLCKTKNTNRVFYTNSKIKLHLSLSLNWLKIGLLAKK